MKNRKETTLRQGNLSRRNFLGGAAGAAAFMIVPRHVLGGAGYTSPSEKLNIAGVGIGGKGAADVRNVNSENIVALCDVDEDYAAKTFKLYPRAKKYTDFRRMLERQKDIDAVMVATPDHTHAVIAMAAMEMGKHVFVQKPLTHNIYEAWQLTEAARKYKVATQMGNQGHAAEGIRMICEWVWDGAIGSVREVHVWTDRPGGRWAQGVDRPKDTPPVPSALDWDIWVGPAPKRPYHPAYVPFKWRGWWDFGTGALGDMGCHIIDVPFWSLKLGRPISVEAETTRVNSETYPVASVVRYEFAVRGDMPAVEMTWYDGGMLPSRPEELEEGRQMGNKSGGVLLVGDKGKILSGHNGESPRLIPESKMEAYERPAETIPRSIGHYKEWIEACKGGKAACSNFDYAGPLTETVLLGNLAIRAGKKLYWDRLNMKVTNMPEANEYISRQYRQGWSL